MEEDIITLRNYSFVSDTPHEAMAKMHRPVQIATRKWLKSHNKDIYWLEQSLLNLDEALPHDDYTDWTECRALLPHARLAFDLEPETQDASLHQASISNKAAAFLLSQGFAIDVHHLAQGSMASRRELLGDEHPDTLTSMANLASTYWNQGRLEEAEELNVSVTEASKKVLGDEHPDTLTSMANLASTYWSQGRWEEAEELLALVTEARKSVLGEGHPNTLTSMANLAYTLISQRRVVMAFVLLKRTINAAPRFHGPDHQDISSWEAALDDM